MHKRLAQQIRGEMDSLVGRYDTRLRAIPGYAELSAAARHSLERRVLELMADCLETNNDQLLIDYIHERAGQVLASGFAPEWFQQAVAVLEELVTPLAATVAESNFVWRTLNRAQQSTWHIVAEERKRLEHEFRASLERRNRPVQTSTEVAQHITAAPELTESTRLLEQLRRSEAQLSEALKLAKLAYWEYDVEKDQFVFNDQFYSIFHSTAEQAGGYRLSATQYAQRFVHPDDLAIVGSEIEKALNSTDRHYTRLLEHRILYADGGVGYISVNVSLDRDEQGRILRYYGTNQDITARKQVEQESLRFKQGLEQASDAVFMTDINGHIIYVNRAFEKIYGYSREEALGQTPRILKSGQLSQEFYQGFWQALLNKQSVSGEKPNKTKEGRVIIVEDSNSPILDSAGTLLGFLSTHRDITERKQAEERLQELLNNVQQSEQLMRTVIDSTSDWIFIKDQEHRYQLVNQGYANSLHIAIEDFIGKNDLDLGFPEERVKGNLDKGIRGFWADDRLVIDSGQTQIYASDPAMIDGVLHIFNISKTPLRDSTGHVWGVLTFARDITDLQRAQEDLLKRNTQLTTFNRLGQALARLLTVEEVVEQVFQAVGEVFDNRNFYLALYDQYKQEVSFPIYTLDGERRAVAGRPFGNGMTEYILRTKQPLLISRDVQNFAADLGIANIGRASHCYLGVPVLSGDTALGVMAVQDYDRENVYSAVDVELLSAVATRLATALENVHLYAIESQRALQLQTASEISRAASSILNAEELLPQAAELIRARFSFYYVGIFLTDETKRWAILQAGTGSAGQQMLANRHPLEISGNSLIGQCILTQQAQIALDVGEKAVHFDNPLLPSTHSEIALPLTSRGRIIGAMTIQSDQPAAFTVGDITVLQSMADQIANALENARLYEQTQTALADTDNLLRASAELNVSQSYDDVLAVLREHTPLGRDALSIAINVFDRPWTVHQTPQWIELIGYSHRQATGMELGTRFPLAVFASAHTLLRADAPTVLEDLSVSEVDPGTRALLVQRLGGKSAIFVPLVVGGQWVGYITVLFAEPTRFREAEVRRLEALIGQAAVAVQNMRNLAGTQQTLTETESLYRATQAIGRAQSTESILEAATPVVQLLGMTQAALRMVTRRDLNGVIIANDCYAYHRLEDRWVLQPILKDAPVNDFAALRPLLRNPEGVMIYKDAQNPESFMPDVVRQTLVTSGLQSAVATSITIQGEVMGFLVFSGPQALTETAEQRIRLTIRTLSDQMAVALQNRQLFEQTQAALQEVDAINRRLTGEAWESYLRQQAGREVIWATDDEVAAPGTLLQLDDQLAAGEITLEADLENAAEGTVTAPILLRGQPIGALRLRTPLNEWTADTESMLADIADHIAQAVENARLIEQTQRTAQRERMINEINARVRQAMDLDAILRTAVNELGQSLKAARVVARVGAVATENKSEPDGTVRGESHA